ncbi:MAG: sulfur carrier protein ThiS [Thermoguttaceae bacterium]|nr:sulfur carrier protein ThiS [Thermoguttaceae bacterium]MDW8079139.1 sulfur carrier protein ThiS [Thermoguttaceae bacterium]
MQTETKKILVHINGQAQEVPAGLTVAALLERYDLARRPLAVEINGDVVPREKHAQRELQPGDRIEIVTLVGGG